MIYLDTHLVVWLYAGEVDRLTTPVRERLERESLLVSPMVQLELEYLLETDRLKVGSALILESLNQSIGLQLCDLPFARVVVESIRQNWTRDLFDRLIVAQALVRGAELLSKDPAILEHYPKAVW